MSVGVALVTVVSGSDYERFAQEMFESATEFFSPDPVIAHITLPGREGWPEATMYRYHVLLENRFSLELFDHVYMIDADMVFRGRVGNEILGDRVATLHPGFVGRNSRHLPYERRSTSRAYVGGGDRYYAGGFVGGTTDSFMWMADRIAKGVDRDAGDGIVACWHDESHLNAVLNVYPPNVLLSPSYCMPDDSSGYPWLSGLERKIVAIDKTPSERGSR